MTEDTHDQGTPSALRPRPGWDKAAQNPDAVHSTLDLTAVASTGYTDPSYQPPKLSPLSDAGELDQLPYKEAQQGHRLARASSPNGTRGGGGGGGGSSSIRGAASHAAVSDGAPTAVPDLEGTTHADGRPAWDSRFILERSAWEVQPRTALLRPPSTNAFPGSGVRGSFPTGTGRSEHSRSPGGRRTSDGDNTLGPRTGGSRIVSTDGNGTRTTILPGLNAASPPIWTSPYGGEVTSPGPGRNATSPGTSPGPGGYTAAAGGTNTALGTAAAAGTTNGAQRSPRTDLLDSYVGRAYSPDQSYFREGSSGGGGGSPGSQGRRGGAGDAGVGAEGDGVDGHGTHLPALERAGYARVKEKEVKEKEKEAQAAAAAKASAQKAAILALGAVYLPPGTKLRIGGSSGGGGGGASARDTSRNSHLLASPPPLYSRSCRSTEDDGGRRAHSLEAGGCGGGGHATDRGRDTSPGPGGGIWRPSGRQPIPDAAPPVPKHTYRSSSGEAKETQEEADRRRAVPRDPAIYSPERYPIVGMGWFLPPEKIPPNPAYMGIKAKYMEARPQRNDDDGAKTSHIPDIHLKPWLTAGKHLVTDSSTPPPKMTGTAGARPPYSFSPSATGTSVAGPGTSRSSKGTARRGRGAARGGGGGGGGGKRNGRRSRGSSIAGESDSEAEDSEVEGEREVLAVIGGVRLMSMTKRHDMQDEARLEAEEDAQMAKEDAEAAQRAMEEERQQQPQQGDTGLGREQESHYSSGLEASGSETRASGERMERDEKGGSGRSVSGKRHSGATEGVAPSSAGRGYGGSTSRGSNRSSRSSNISRNGGGAQVEGQRGGSGGNGYGPEAEAEAGGDSGGDKDDDDGFVGSRVPASREVSQRSGDGKDEAEAGGLGGEQEEEEGVYKEGGDAEDEASNGDDDDGDLAAQAAMAGLGDSDGDGDVDADAGGGDDEEEVAGNSGAWE
ncbi:hypothetical protein VOLCADRAFT_98681 [Volvox carteri f. nagariensis]|uniref:Uncharacterized protein n=1 Tax=Volvox carteri f. nagariensis TaxID=3068 RepID=D8UG02_VOLCA|nr:uncharacterized protein VOLCADRAFT_98681 [Volvox carteri f. nagariensis]EFJ41368.1 hypothetical protein VOLCADRAFT_98681 [Volvox carteri f. nagariensis]|eukprot:XP_002957598.1 hypothetical protein VOLCADRAFT_98681 [Volvox carteri f. nagariensis]